MISLTASLLAFGPLLVPWVGETSGGDLAAEVDQLVADWDRPDLPGGAIAILRDGEPALVRTFGMADLGEQRAVNRDTPFYLASLAKPFTAACALHAARAGQLDLDASLRDVFPNLPASYAAATLRDCLSHRSGVPDFYDVAIGVDLGPEVLESNAAVLELLSHLPQLSFQPGEQFLYSNSGYVLLAEALRRGTGQTLAEYAREHIFEPRGMRAATYLGEPDSAVRPRSYAHGPAGWIARDVGTGTRGPGGLCASLDDLIQ